MRYLREEAELRREGWDCLEPVRRRVNPHTPHRAWRFGLFRPRRIEEAAREVARSGHHAERDQFLAGNAVVDEVPLERLSTR